MYRATRRPSPSVEATAHYSPVSQSASPVAVDMAQELYVEAVEDSAEDSAETSGPDSENAANGQRAAHRE
jgi:hypothetical protein